MKKIIMIDTVLLIFLITIIGFALFGAWVVLNQGYEKYTNDKQEKKDFCENKGMVYYDTDCKWIKVCEKNPRGNISYRPEYLCNDKVYVCSVVCAYKYKVK